MWSAVPAACPASASGSSAAMASTAAQATVVIRVADSVRLPTTMTSSRLNPRARPRSIWVTNESSTPLKPGELGWKPETSDAVKINTTMPEHEPDDHRDSGQPDGVEPDAAELPGVVARFGRHAPGRQHQQADRDRRREVVRGARRRQAVADDHPGIEGPGGQPPLHQQAGRPPARSPAGRRPPATSTAPRRTRGTALGSRGGRGHRHSLGSRGRFRAAVREPGLSSA